MISREMTFGGTSLAQIRAARDRARAALSGALNHGPMLKRAAAIAGEAAMQADTAVRGAANVFTFGNADRIAAAGDAAIASLAGADFAKSFRTNLELQQLRTREDSSLRPRAQLLGQAGGAIAGVSAVSSPTVLVPRLPGAAALSGREAAAMLTGGGAAGLGVQIGSDLAQGRQGSAGDNAGAVIGGGAGAAALPLGTTRAGAVGSAVTVAAQDYLNGEPLDTQGVSEAALVGGLFGAVTDGAVQVWARDLAPVKAGKIGQALGELRAKVNGLPLFISSTWRDNIPGTGRYWYPDAGSPGGIRFEFKLGEGADLSPNQELAQEILGKKFILYHLLPGDLGAATTVPAGGIASHLEEEARQ